LPDPGLDIHLLAVLVDEHEMPFVDSALIRFRDQFPGISITLFSLASKGDVLAGCCPERKREELVSLVAEIRNLECDAAVVFTSPGQSPHSAAYLCYLAGIPVRIGRSLEFGGGVLTHWVKTLPEKDPVDRHLSLLRLIGLPGAGATPSSLKRSEPGFPLISDL
jgi:hypothetical protein